MAMGIPVCPGVFPHKRGNSTSLTFNRDFQFIASSLHSASHQGDETFCQQAPIVLEYLHSILQQYRMGGRSSWSDPREPTHLGPPAQQSRGPALLAYNNTMMSRQDWTGIQDPEVSHKQKDPHTVGRIGLGFNSVYHLTWVSSPECICNLTQTFLTEVLLAFLFLCHVCHVALHCMTPDGVQTLMEALVTSPQLFPVPVPFRELSLEMLSDMATSGDDTTLLATLK
ncbi:hypothetical protein TURU_128190 [Turdus rufiventris]|nr:hypothetical protein TURU_128190 [Turdus rufiventris]